MNATFERRIELTGEADSTEAINAVVDKLNEVYGGYFWLENVIENDTEFAEEYGRYSYTIIGECDGEYIYEPRDRYAEPDEDSGMYEEYCDLSDDSRDYVDIADSIDGILMENTYCEIDNKYHDPF